MIGDGGRSLGGKGDNPIPPDAGLQLPQKRRNAKRMFGLKAGLQGSVYMGRKVRLLTDHGNLGIFIFVQINKDSST